MLASSFISKIYFLVHLYPKNNIFTHLSQMHRFFTWNHLTQSNYSTLPSMRQNFDIKRNDLVPPDSNIHNYFNRHFESQHDTWVHGVAYSFSLANRYLRRLRRCNVDAKSVSVYTLPSRYSFECAFLSTVASMFWYLAGTREPRHSFRVTCVHKQVGWSTGW